jgi:hypothetical protein
MPRATAAPSSRSPSRPGHDLGEPAPQFADDVLDGHEAIREIDVVDLATAQRRNALGFNTSGVARYFEDGQTGLGLAVAVGAGDQQDPRRSVRIRAPRLLPLSR